jgi:hypothetical protein
MTTLEKIDKAIEEIKVNHQGLAIILLLQIKSQLTPEFQIGEKVLEKDNNDIGRGRTKMNETLAKQVEDFESKWGVTFYEPDEFNAYYHVSSFLIDPIIEAEITTDYIDYFVIESFYDKEFVSEFKAIIEMIKKEKTEQK